MKKQMDIQGLALIVSLLTEDITEPSFSNNRNKHIHQLTPKNQASFM